MKDLSERTEYAIRRVADGATYGVIGREMGITGPRVRQLAVRARVRLGWDETRSVKEACQEWVTR
jgi:DNA-binding CsgD family transcriptional regulator